MDFVVGGAYGPLGGSLEGSDSEPDVWLRTLATFPDAGSNLRHPSFKELQKEQVVEAADVSVNRKSSRSNFVQSQSSFASASTYPSLLNLTLCQRVNSLCGGRGRVV